MDVRSGSESLIRPISRCLMNCELPLVSVIVPSFNQGTYIAETLDSIFSQDYSRLEVIVVDGASRDETVDILKRYEGRPRFSWISEPDTGVVDAVNKGLARATGDLCGIQSSDDCYTPGAVAAAVAEFQKNPELLVAYADAEYINAQSQTIGRTRIGDYAIEDLFSKRTFVMQSSAFFRTEAALLLGGWRSEVAYSADNDLWLRMALQGPFRRVPAVWSRYRLHEQQRDTHGSRIVKDWRQSIDDLSAKLSPRLRRAARVGCHLTAYRYAAQHDSGGKTRSLYAALAADPRCLFWAEFPRIELLQPLRQALSRCKRVLTGRRATKIHSGVNSPVNR